MIYSGPKSASTVTSSTFALSRNSLRAGIVVKRFSVSSAR